MALGFPFDLIGKHRYSDTRVPAYENESAAEVFRLIDYRPLAAPGQVPFDGADQTLRVTAPAGASTIYHRSFLSCGHRYKCTNSALVSPSLRPSPAAALARSASALNRLYSFC